MSTKRNKPFRTLPGYADMRIACDLVRMIVGATLEKRLVAARAILAEINYLVEQGYGAIVPHGIGQQAAEYLKAHGQPYKRIVAAVNAHGLAYAEPPALPTRE